MGINRSRAIINQSNWWAGLRAGLSDAGTVTAEYAVATLGACGFAGLLLGLLRSGEIKNLLFGIVKRGLNVG